MKMKKTGRNHGFSLIELIIAIAILVILTGLLAPQFMKYIEKARMAKCLNNMDTILKEYQIRLIDGEFEGEGPEEMLELIKELEIKCPSGVEYKVEEIKSDTPLHNDDEKTLKLSCPVHGGNDTEVDTDPNTAVVKKQVSEMENFLGMSAADIKNLENWAKHNAGYAENNLSNDTFRNYIISEYYEGRWPQLSTDLLEKNGISGNFYVQPYLNGKYTDPDNCNITIFASTHATTKESNLWAPDLVYKNGQWWYKGKDNANINLVGKSQEQIDELTASWKPLAAK